MHDTSPTALVPVEGASREDRLREQADDLHSRLRQTETRFARAAAAWARKAREDRLAANAELIAALLPTLDSLQLATQSVHHEHPLREGLAIAHRELAHTLAAFGLVTHSPRVGQPFDPRFEQAVSFDDAPGFGEGEITEVLRDGHSLGGQLLRPALVSVARARSLSSISATS